MDRGTLQLKLARLERELLALKTFAKASPRIQAYTKTATISASGTVTVKYGDGNQPILSEFYFNNGDAAGLVPSGNSQTVIVFSQVVGTLTVVSTRPIISIG